MLRRLKAFLASYRRGVLLWAAICLLLIPGLVGSLLELSWQPAQETRQANSNHQRVVVAATTGVVSGLESGEAAASFDVGEEGNDINPPSTGDQLTAETVDQPVLPQDLPELHDAPQVTQMPSIPRGSDSLVQAPAPEISEKAGAVTLPKRSTTNSASHIYARGFHRSDDAHVLAVVITDAGFSPASLAGILALPREVAAGMSPYADNVGAQITTLHHAGHEVWGMLPAVGEHYPEDDPGPLGLIGNLSPEQSLDRLHEAMAATIGSVGLILPAEETISGTEKVWPPVLAEIDGRGLYLLSLRHDRSLDQLTPDKKRQAMIRRADMILDSTPSAAFIRSKLGLIEDELADHDLIIVASARPQTLTLLGQWLKEQKDITLAPPSALYQPAEEEKPEEEKPAAGHH